MSQLFPVSFAVSFLTRLTRKDWYHPWLLVQYTFQPNSDTGHGEATSLALPQVQNPDSNTTRAQHLPSCASSFANTSLYLTDMRVVSIFKFVLCQKQICSAIPIHFAVPALSCNFVRAHTHTHIHSLRHTQGQAHTLGEKLQTENYLVLLDDSSCSSQTPIPSCQSGFAAAARPTLHRAHCSPSLR